MRLVFFGTPEFAIPSLEMLLGSEAMEVVAVVTQPDKRRGRGTQLIPSPIKKIALEYQLPIWQPKSIKKNQSTLIKLRESQADAFVVVAYGQILSAEILAMPRLGCINVHGSLLPQYRGAAPIQWSIYHGETITGVTTMLMDQGMDSGAMLLKATTPIDLWVNGVELGQQLSIQGAELLKQTLNHFSELTPVPQDPALVSYAPLLDKENYLIDWSKSAIAIHNQIRGFYPDCLTRWRNQDLKILATAPLVSPYWSQLPAPLQELATQLQGVKGQVGEVITIVKKLGPIIQTGDGLLLLLEVQPPGKRIQSGVDFVNGMRLQIGENLVQPAS